ncbi:MAG: hypothetical protein U0K66_07570 [Paludibacteraceae bacterium]|nr:hypothetical protein [Paludibacteraceae bacterium]
MKKLLLSIVSLIASTSVFAELSFDKAYWIIKDGKLTDNVEIYEYDPEDLDGKVPSELKDTTVDGENLVVYKQLSDDYLDVRLKFNSDKPLDLSENYVMVFEYKIPDFDKDTNIYFGNKPLWMFGFTTQEKLLKSKNASTAETFSFVDAKWGPTEEWVTTYKYIYAKASMKQLFGMNFSYAREYNVGGNYCHYKGVLKEYPYIKNMAFVSIKEGKPFYAENFDNVKLGDFYLEELKVATKEASAYHGGIQPIFTEEYADYWEGEGRSPLYLFRDFMPDSVRNQDGSGHIDCEQLHALQVESVRDSIVFPEIKIPTGTEKIYSKMLIKKHKNEKGYWEDADYDVYSKEDLPIILRFNTGETVDLTNDTIKMIWTKFEGEVKVPSGAESFDLVFKGAKAGYLVDDIMFSSKKFADVKVDQVDSDAFDIVAYVDENGDIVVENGELVAAYNMEGRAATKADKVVAIVVKNDKGQLASKVILRK